MVAEVCFLAVAGLTGIATVAFPAPGPRLGGNAGTGAIPHLFVVACAFAGRRWQPFRRAIRRRRCVGPEQVMKGPDRARRPARNATSFRGRVSALSRHHPHLSLQACPAANPRPGRWVQPGWCGRVNLREALVAVLSSVSPSPGARKVNRESQGGPPEGRFEPCQMAWSYSAIPESSLTSLETLYTLSYWPDGHFPYLTDPTRV